MIQKVSSAFNEIPERLRGHTEQPRRDLHHLGHLRLRSASEQVRSRCVNSCEGAQGGLLRAKPRLVYKPSEENLEGVCAL